MKFFHLSDLHLGKRLNDFSLLEDQRHILDQILDLADRHHPDGVLIAGDVYDKAVPPTEAVSLLDTFLTHLAERGIEVFLISGNHDSAERLAFGAQLLSSRGIHISPVYQGPEGPVVLRDAFGPVHVYLLPFLKPAAVRRVSPDAAIESYQDAVAWAVGQLPLDPTARNVLLAHQFVTGAERCASEEVSVGGLDAVDAALFAAFDYVALGHIHGPQWVGPHLRYCGTPLKYSFSEATQEKSVTVVELGEKGCVDVSFLPLTPLRDMRELRGTYAELTARETYRDTPTGDYLHITLTDEEDIPDAAAKLRIIYPHLMRLDYDNCRTRSESVPEGAAAVEQKTPLALLEEFYLLQNGQPLSDGQRTLFQALIEEIWEGAQ